MGLLDSIHGPEDLRPLDREERMLMNQHPSIGAEIVAPARQRTQGKRALHAAAPVAHLQHDV